MISSNIFEPLKILVVFAILGMLVFGFACAGLTSHAPMHGGMNAGTMTSATDQQKCCNTTIAKYLDSLKENILVTTRDVRDILTLLVFSLVLTLVFVGSLFQRTFNSKLAFFRLYARANPDITLFNRLRLAFAQGILNPKIY